MGWDSGTNTTNLKNNYRWVSGRSAPPANIGNGRWIKKTKKALDVMTKNNSKPLHYDHKTSVSKMKSKIHKDKYWYF